MVKIINSSGKKKTSIARATFKKGSGKVRINKKPVEILEPELAREKVLEPLILAEDLVSGLDIDINIHGGGFMSQAEACRTALGRGIIAWANDIKLKEKFLDYDRNLLVSDHRQKETKKFGGRGARAKRQKSYR